MLKIHQVLSSKIPKRKIVKRRQEKRLKQEKYLEEGGDVKLWWGSKAMRFPKSISYSAITVLEKKNLLNFVAAVLVLLGGSLNKSPSGFLQLMLQSAQVFLSKLRGFMTSGWMPKGKFVNTRLNLKLFFLSFSPSKYQLFSIKFLKLWKYQFRP